LAEWDGEGGAVREEEEAAALDEEEAMSSAEASASIKVHVSHMVSESSKSRGFSAKKT
jgi:hypothetical protein